MAHNHLVQDTYFEVGVHALAWGGYDEGEKQENEQQYDVLYLPEGSPHGTQP